MGKEIVLELEGGVALVTGAASGIGRSVALALAKAGADVAVADLDLDEATKMAWEVRSLGRRAVAVKVDVSNSREVTAAVDKVVESLGKIDILFNFAGIIERSPVVEMSEDSWDRILHVNLRGTFLMCRAVAKQMLEQGIGGKIITVGSSLAETPDATRSAYAASKAGVIAFSQALACEVGPHGINVNVIIPGATDTAMLRNQFSTEQIAEIGERQIIRRVNYPNDYDGLAVFLASKASDYMHGKVI